MLLVKYLKKLVAAGKGDIVAFAKAAGADGTRSDDAGFRSTAIYYDETVTPPKLTLFPV